MLRQLNIQINCGNTTCASKPGEFCEQLYASNFGTKPVCHLFNDTPLYEHNGWLQRCEECLNKVTTVVE